MKRPAIKDKPTLQYVEYLEAQIEDFKKDTKKKFYRGVQRQLDLIADELLSEGFKVSIQEGEGNKGEFDKFFDMLTKGTAIAQSMEKFEKQAIPQEDKKVIDANTADAFLQ